MDVIDYIGRPDPTLWRGSGGQRARNYARTSRIGRAVDSECGNRCARLGRCWLRSGATTATVNVAGTSERHSGILESHFATTHY
jgi:hypothetical protein